MYRRTDTFLFVDFAVFASKITLIAACSMLAVAAMAQDSLRVAPGGNVGIGTSTPTEKLHVQDWDAAQVLVENVSTQAAQRVPFRIINKGKARFVIVNTEANAIWTFDNAGQRFNISRAGTGVPELEVATNGDLIVAYGQVYSQGFNNVSSRTVKTDFEPVGGADILSKVASLPVSSWSYKSDPEARHIGPMAEDFKSVFGLGNGQHINLVDATGISLAAIKALEKELRAKNKAIQELESRFKTEFAELRARLDSIDQSN